MTLTKVICANCKKEFEKEIKYVNCSKRQGMLLYCDIQCVGKAKRKYETPMHQRRAARRRYRERHLERVRARSREWARKNYDPVKAAAARKKRKAHIQRTKKLYYLKPENLKRRRELNKKNWHRRKYGEFFEASIINLEFKRLVKQNEQKQKRINGRKSKNRTMGRTSKAEGGTGRNDVCNGSRIDRTGDPSNGQPAA